MARGGWRAGWGALAILGSLLAGCSAPLLAPDAEPTPVRAPAPSAAQPPVVSATEAASAQWVPVDWRELPGWGEDDALAAWPALLSSCQRPPPVWREFCARAVLQAPGDTTEATLFLMKHLRPWRLQSGGDAAGLLTGYFEPQLVASRVRQGAFQWPLHALPADAALRRTPRAEIEANRRFAPLEMAYLDDPVGLLMLQVQGSGRLLLRDGAGAERWVRVAYAGHNERAYESVARLLMDRGELRDGSWAGLRDWMRLNPARVKEVMALNPRVVYFREEALVDALQGPRGAQGQPLTPARSVAVDRSVWPLGTPLWLDSTEPLSTRPLRRLVFAQDTGSAITGAQRADFFWGWGDEAAQLAGRTRQPLRLWALWPQGMTPGP
ncbi:MAG: transglycosylase [Roseateles depolymerans]|uniref:peptidoglycan lytic exotransglycosylase n=1 Tax=Roseateles depolymerans TaxID=76731 RepID=A0A2W5FNH1_9BURK|nr:MAG: transglycosylase [Roseateles depolymerans]